MIFRNVVFILAFATLTGCNKATELQMSDIEVVGAGQKASPAIAVSPNGLKALAWVEAADGPRGQLSVQVGDRPAASIHDSLGLVQSHSEAPPQMVFAGEGNIHIAYVVTKDVGSRFPKSSLRMVSSSDSGVTWGSPVTITDDTLVFGAHNFHSLNAGEDGSLYVSWLDGRNGTVSTYMAVSKDAGNTWSKNVKISIGESCPCCRTSVVGTENGTVYVAWRAVLEGGIRDIVVARSSDFGVTWEAPRRVHADNWQYNGCPHAGPSIKVDQDGKLHVLWWTGKPENGGVFYARSDDNAQSFTTPIPVHSQPVPIPTHVQLGLPSTEGKAKSVVAVWDDLTGNPTGIVMRASVDGGDSFASVVEVSGKSRSGTHPILALSGNKAHIIWIEKDEGVNIMSREVTFRR